MELEAIRMRSINEEIQEYQDVARTAPSECRSWSVVGCCVRWIIAALLAAVVGSWLVWYAAYIQRQQSEEDIRAACRRVMPESADRCFDTVVIQRGGIRR
jgi:hypothetical protein